MAAVNMFIFLLILTVVAQSVTSYRTGPISCENYNCGDQICVDTILGPRCKENSNGRCNLPAEPGMCRAYMPRWYYDAKSKSCKTFVYGGCGGNDNRFASEKTCKRACLKRLCNLPAEPGMCRAYMPRWYYDAKSKSCKTFVYGGCGGNDNRFASEETCKRACLKKSRCDLPAETGTCKGFFRKWYYDAKSGTCKTFIYGGCGGNKNKFASKKRCERVCSKSG